ncbi:response regulator transcription factor [Halalkalibacter lacteus]|uniref:response regulator transcription factor n=1 Tax=Halalkalibacter lacteus TaxID=3090663 RepID=UPI002FCB9BF8
MVAIKTIIVDDEPRIRRGIERLVKSFDVDWDIVGTYSDGKEAYDAIINSHIKVDLLITDVKMPEMDGLTLVKELRKSHFFFAFFISGFDDFKYLQTAIREGAINYILKPINREQFAVDLQEVKKKIIAKREEHQSLKEVQERASKLTYATQVQLLSEMTWLNDKDVSFLNWTKEFPTGKYKLSYISIDQTVPGRKGEESKECEIWSFAVENILEEMLMNEFINYGTRKWWWRNGRNNFWVLLFEQDKLEMNEFSALTEQFLVKVKDNIRRFTIHTASISESSVFHDLTQLPSYKNQLLSLLQYRLIQGGNKLFKYDLINEAHDLKPKGSTPVIYMRTQQILHGIEKYDEKKVVKALQTFFDELEHLSSPRLVEEALHYLFIQIVNLWMENDGYWEDPYLLTEAIQMTKWASSFSELKGKTKDWLMSIMKKIQLLRDDHPDSIQQAKDWIHENLGDNITVKKIADHVYMNPTYFCEYFKKMTGVTVLDYVTKKRLEKAKKLLELPDIKIYDISSLVGYHDPKYFSKLFKKWQGYSPSEYRESYFKRTSIK